MKAIFKLNLLKFVKGKMKEFASELSAVALQQRNYFDALFVIVNPRIDISKIKAKVLRQLIVVAGAGRSAGSVDTDVQHPTDH